MNKLTINIDFYILKDQSINAAGLFICRLAEKVYQKGHWLYIYSNSKTELLYLNDILWTFNDINFIPHDLYENNQNSAAPILLGQSGYPTSYCDILMNLAPEVPEFYKSYNRILEIIPADTILKAAGREKYKFYQQLGYNINLHNL